MLSYKTETTKERLSTLLELQKGMKAKIYVPDAQDYKNTDDAQYYQDLENQYHALYAAFDLIISYESARLVRNISEDLKEKEG